MVAFLGVCLFAWVSVCLFAWVSVWLFAWVSVWLFVWVSETPAPALVDQTGLLVLNPYSFNARICNVANL